MRQLDKNLIDQQLEAISASESLLKAAKAKHAKLVLTGEQLELARQGFADCVWSKAFIDTCNLVLLTTTALTLALGFGALYLVSCAQVSQGTVLAVLTK